MNTTQDSTTMQDSGVSSHQANPEYLLVETSTGVKENSIPPNDMEITQQIEMYGTLVFAPLGIMFNLLSSIIFVKLKFQKSAAGLHLLLFTVSETLMLVGILMSRPMTWAQHTNIPVVDRLHTTYCFVVQFIFSSQLVWSSLLLLTATIERFVAVTFPLRAKSWNLWRVSKIMATTNTFISFVLGIIGGLGKTLNKNTFPNSCKDNPKHEMLTLLTRIVTYTVLGNTIGPILVLIFTVLIARTIYKQFLIRKNLACQADTQRTKEFHITVMLFITACVFLMSRIFLIIVWYLRTKTNFHQVSTTIFPLALFFGTMSHSVNFLVYLYFFQNFRKVFISWFMPILNSTTQENIQTISHSSVVQANEGVVLRNASCQ